MVGSSKGVAVLSDREQQVWNDVERFWAEDAQEPSAAGRAAEIPRTPRPRKLDDAPLRVILSFWAAVFLGFFGAHAMALALAVVAGLALALCRY
jgi:Na+(H+)/acetate symporter ActP